MNSTLTSLALPTLLAALFAGSGPTAQEPGSTPGSNAPTEPRKFLPSDYDSVAFVDMRALLDSGLFDVLERSMLRPLLESFARAHGFYLSDIDTYRWAQHRTFDENGWRQSVSVMVFEGGEKVGLAHVDPKQLGESYTSATIGGASVITDPGVRTLVSPREGSLVEGDASVVDPTLLGKRIGGVPVPDLLALTAEPGDIAYLAGMVDSEFEQSGGVPPLPGDWFDPTDPPRALMLRVMPHGKGLRLEARMRFRDGNVGPARLRAQFDDWLKTLGDDPRLRMLSPTLRKTKTAVDHADFVATLDIDQPERIFSVALNTSGSLLFLAFSGGAAVAQPVKVIEMKPKPAPKAVPAPAEDGGPPEEPPDPEPKPAPDKPR